MKLMNLTGGIMDFVQFLNERKGEMSYRVYADILGVNFATLHRFLAQGYDLNVRTIRVMAARARERDDSQLMDAMKRYLGLEVEAQ